VLRRIKRGELSVVHLGVKKRNGLLGEHSANEKMMISARNLVSLHKNAQTRLQEERVVTIERIGTLSGFRENGKMTPSLTHIGLLPCVYQRDKAFYSQIRVACDEIEVGVCMKEKDILL
jgi:hypothetical protein